MGQMAATREAVIEAIQALEGAKAALERSVRALEQSARLFDRVSTDDRRAVLVDLLRLGPMSPTELLSRFRATFDRAMGYQALYGLLRGSARFERLARGRWTLATSGEVAGATD